jgi:hypothetical protein
MCACVFHAWRIGYAMHHTNVQEPTNCLSKKLKESSNRKSSAYNSKKKKAKKISSRQAGPLNSSLLIKVNFVTELEYVS